MLVKGSFEDYIYIVVGVIWIAYSIYKGTQKGKSKTRKPAKSQNQEEKKKSVFETFFDEILVDEKQNPYEAVPDEIEVKEFDIVDEKVEEEVFSFDDYYEESNLQSKIEVSEVESIVQNQQKKDLEITPSKKRRKPRIDLRKAVIYSEILNRRYF